MVGVVSKSVAVQMAEDAELDLVIVSPEAEPPVVKLMDYNWHQGVKGLRDTIAPRIEPRDGFPADPNGIFLIDGASPAMWWLAGQEVSKFCAKFLHQQVLKHEAYSVGDIGTAAQKSFLRSRHMGKDAKGGKGKRKQAGGSEDGGAESKGKGC
ncbi:hypothetical protein SSX86_028758 [Deinandra increscens subsp. villosa]|uniref:Translation initiation factor 3 N-terminal domain-containing protein n=1 Tax=Deinandra increscens subsp. villosa TaxID=3103831 RepID=A0AAP0CDN2_9ASTR